LSGADFSGEAFSGGLFRRLFRPDLVLGCRLRLLPGRVVGRRLVPLGPVPGVSGKSMPLGRRLRPLEARSFVFASVFLHACLPWRIAE
jgi:hypothetical protein